MLSSAAALELGEIRVSSEEQQILDAEVSLHGIETDNLSNWHIIPADQDEYQAQGLQYINGLHDRLVMEIVASASEPYVAVSSIVSINRRNFDLIVRIGNGKESVQKIYQVVLKEPPAPIVEVIRAMTPAEILNYLTNKLATLQKISRAEAWGQLQSLVTETDQGGEQKLITSINSAELSLSFTIGIGALLNERQKAFFNRIKAESGNARAVAAALFGQRDFLILKALFKQATVHTLEVGTTKSNQLDFERERAAILENTLYELRYAKIREDLAVQERAKEPPPESEHAEALDWLDYQSWLVYLDWGKKPLLSNAKVWLAISVFLGILLLLLSIRLFLGQQTPAVGRPVDASRTKMFLPGQKDLEKLRTPQVYINPADKEDKEQKGDDDPIIAKLNRAEAYIEMGEHEEARRLLKEIEQQSQDPQQIAHIRNLRDKME